MVQGESRLALGTLLLQTSQFTIHSHGIHILVRWNSLKNGDKTHLINSILIVESTQNSLKPWEWVLYPNCYYLLLKEYRTM